MKVFLITWVVLCFLVIVGLFIAYATDQFPGIPVPKQIGLEADENCSPCEEKWSYLLRSRLKQTQTSI